MRYHEGRGRYYWHGYAPEHYLLPRYQRGQLRLTEIADMLDVSVYHVLWHWRNIDSSTQTEFQALFATSLRFLLT